MPKKPSKLSQQAQKDLAFVRRSLLSGQEKHYRAARKLIKKYQKEGVTAFDAADVFDRVKKWIENATDEVKDIAYAEATVQLARQKSFADSGDWYDVANAARGLRYGCRFNLARRRYNRAVELMGDLTQIDARKAEVLADYAEFWAYLGYTDNAEKILNLIPARLLTGWLFWVKAFVQHQAAFVSKYPIGTRATDSLGSISFYNDAKYSLSRALDGLSTKEQADSYLLLAAIWGGIHRCLVAESAPPADIRAAKAEAEAALVEFKKGDPVNQHWSWRKEKRGAIVTRWVRGIDEAWLGRDRVRDWRGVLSDHFMLNLRVAGLKPQAEPGAPPGFRDGDPPKPNDPGDDEEKP